MTHLETSNGDHTALLVEAGVHLGWVEDSTIDPELKSKFEGVAIVLRPKEGFLSGFSPAVRKAKEEYEKMQNRYGAGDVIMMAVRDPAEQTGWYIGPVLVKYFNKDIEDVRTDMQRAKYATHPDEQSAHMMHAALSARGVVLPN